MTHVKHFQEEEEFVMEQIPNDIFRKILFDFITNPSKCSMKEAARLSGVNTFTWACYENRLHKHKNILEASRNVLNIMRMLHDDWGHIKILKSESRWSIQHNMPSLIFSSLQNSIMITDKLFFPRNACEPFVKNSFLDIDNQIIYYRFQVHTSPQSYIDFLSGHKEIIKCWQTVWALVILKNTLFVSDEAHDLLIIKSNNQLNHIASKIMNFQHYLGQYPGVNEWIDQNIVPSRRSDPSNVAVLPRGKYYTHSFIKSIPDIKSFIDTLMDIPIVCQVNVGI